MTAVRIKGLVSVLLIGLGMLAQLSSAFAQSPPDPDPVVMKVSLMDCFAQIEGGTLEPDDTGRGFGNIPQDRSFHVELAYHYSDPENKAAAAAKIGRIELCWFEPKPEPQKLLAHCPGGAWVVFDRQHPDVGVPTGNPDTATIHTCRYDTHFFSHANITQDLMAPIADCGPIDERSEIVGVRLPAIHMEFDWGNAGPASFERGLFIRVFENGEDPVAAEEMSYEQILETANEHGTCANHSVQAASPSGETPSVRIIAPDPNFKPFGTSVNLCIGSRVVQLGPRDQQPLEPYLSPRLLCLPNEGQADYFRKIMQEIFRTQEQRIQGKLQSTEKVQTWRNGMIGSDWLPFNVITTKNSMYETRVHSNFLPRNLAYSIDPDELPETLTDLTDRIDGTMAIPFGIANISTHEAFHALQGRWGAKGQQEDAAGHLVWPGTFFSESLPESVMSTACLLNFPNEPNAQRCLSSAKILDWNTYSNPTHAQYFYSAREVFAVPEKDTLLNAYESGAFWSYIYEQFAYPVSTIDEPNTAHPGGFPSNIQRELEADTLTPRQRLYSDQGQDFLGLLFRQIVQESSLTNIHIFDVADDALQTNLGRSFSDVVFDFHTAMYLKDYTDTDPRWRFDWAHGDGFNADTTTASLKPIKVPPNIVGRTKDGLVRTRRTLDNWIACWDSDCTPARATVPLGEHRLVPNVQLGPYGTTALSVSLDPAWIGTQAIMRVVAYPGDSPRFRVFRIDRYGDNRIPTPLCGVSPSFECILAPLPNSPQGHMALDLTVTADTDEFILIASNAEGSDYAHFDWSVGPSGAQLFILEPGPSRPAFIGTATNPKSFMLRLNSRDPQGGPADIVQGDLTVSVPNCALGPGACVVPAEGIQFVGLGEGSALIVVSLPPEFYTDPTTGGLSFLDVEVSTPNRSPVVASNALQIGTDTQATVLVLDRSGSMNQYGKLDALKTAAVGLLQSLAPGDPNAPVYDKIGLVMFSNDAVSVRSGGYVLMDSTPGMVEALKGFVDGMTAEGGTSIGDGVMEAQSNLAESFDGLPMTDRPKRQTMIVLTDGLQNVPADSDIYFDPDPANVPVGDETGPWIGVPYTWPARAAVVLPQPLPLPNHIQTIGIGDEADMIRLARLSGLTGDAPLHIPVPITMAGAQVVNQVGTALLINLADVITASYTNSSRYGRFLSGQYSSIEVGDGLDLAGIGAGAQELRVVVIGDEANSRGLVLQGPSGMVGPSQSSPGAAAFKVDSPQGDWSLTTYNPTPIPDGGSGDPAPTVDWFVEATVISPFVLHTVIDVAREPMQGDGPNTNQARVGSPVTVRAIPREGVAVRNCTITATVTDPTGLSTPMVLFDDGRHADGSLGDGVYGNNFGATAASGGYRVDTAASCTSPGSGETILRERADGFFLDAIPAQDDTDQDGMPDTWELSFGMDPDYPPDAGEDWDDDDLPNVEEFRAGTNPLVSDTDRGGESDGSEVAYGSNPLDWSDDRTSQPLGLPDPGNGVVQILTGMSLGDADFVVERGPTAEGPFAEVPDAYTPGTHYAADFGVENGTTYCYRVRIESSELTSGWSSPRCVVPSSDSYAPRLRVTGQAERTCNGNEITIPLEYVDLDPSTQAGENFRIPMGTAASGVVEVRYWPGVGDAPVGLPWVPISNPLPISDIDPQVNSMSVQVRDRAGNLSVVQTLLLPPPAICVTADAGPDQTVECTDEGAAVEMDATNSQGSTSEPLTFSWSASGVAFDDPSSPTAVGWFSPGTTTATVTVANSGGTATDWVDITVVDTTPPTLTVPPDVTVTNCVSPNIGTATASDTCGGVTISNNRPATFPAGLTLVTYTATDSAGNVTTGVQRVITVLGDSTACCPPGSHVMMGTSNNDTLIGTSGVDCIVALGGQDTINGMGGNDVISGGEGDDNIQGGSGDDYIWGGNGQDPINGGTGADYIDGGGGDDTCRGGDQNDTIRGGQGQDKLYGENGNDLLFGDDGDDRLEGGYGDDTLNGGGLHDTCIGGPGTDTFLVCQTIQQ